MRSDHLSPLLHGLQVGERLLIGPTTSHPFPPPGPLWAPHPAPGHPPWPCMPVFAQSHITRQSPVRVG